MLKNNISYLLTLFIFSILVALYVYWFGFARINPYPSQNNSIYSQTDQTITLYLEMQPPKIYEENRISLRLNGIFYYDSNPDYPYSKICIDSIDIYSSGSTNTLVYPTIGDKRQYLGDGIPVCGEIEISTNSIPIARSKISLDSRFDKPEVLMFEHSPILYPYDSFRFGIAPIITYYYVNNEGEKVNHKAIQPNLEVYNKGYNEWNIVRSNASENKFWELWSNSSNNPNINGNINEISIVDLKKPDYVTFSRKPPLMLLFPIFILTLLIFIAYINNKKEVFVQGAIAILFGIYSFKEIFSPGPFTTETLVDISIIGLYLIFAFSFIYQIFYSIDRGKKLKNEANEPEILEERTDQINQRQSDLNQKYKNNNLHPAIWASLGISFMILIIRVIKRWEG
jgi:hypothetical protein